MDDLKKLVQIKYGIDLSEDIETLKVKLPYCGEKEGCKNLKYSGGLFTQCCKECDGDFCKVCKVEINKDGPKYGTTVDRMKFNLGEFVANTGKMEVDYLKYMKQHGYTNEMVINAAKVRDLTLPEDLFNGKKKVSQTSKVQVKRDVIVDDSASDISEPPIKVAEVKRGRGRPRKEVKTVTNDVDEEEKPKDVPKQKTEKKQDKLEQKIEIEPEPKLEPELEIDNQEEQTDSDSDSDEEEEIEVRKFNFKGIEYLKDIHNNTVYNKQGEVIGVYNEKTDEIE